MLTKRPRATGTVVTFAPEPEGDLAKQAKIILAQREARLKAEAIKRAERPVPNRICYAEAFANHKPGTRLPRCKRCDATLFPEENHKCEGFAPKYEVWTDERKERASARREAIRESRPERTIICSVCGEELREPEDAERHWDNHEGRPERERHAVDGEPDGDMDGYEDYCEEDGLEEDYCEGGDDGCDCE